MIWHIDLKLYRYAVNVPLRDGITDASYKDIFESVSCPRKCASERRVLKHFRR
jgi:acetoin utilization deacetylase AcuC-like enzyme